MRTFTTLPPLLFVVIFLCLSSGFTESFAVQKIRCIERERQALLDFKHGLENDTGVLSSWGSDVDQRECCNWWGVHCNNNTGHVTILDLYQDDLYMVAHKVSPSLLELKYLSYLDLSNINFQWRRIPKFIGSFRRLQVLRLIDTNFTGTIPSQLWNLTSLRVLYITGPNLKIKNLECLTLLSSLRSIYLYKVDIDLTDESTRVSLPPFLEELHMPSCGLHKTLPFLLNSSSPPFLSVVDFSENHLTSPLVFNLLGNASKQLTSIDLSKNNFTGPIPDVFGDMNFLKSITLNENSFANEIPKSFGNLTNLQVLSLSGNQLNESIAGLLEKLSEGAGKSLRTLYLSVNKLIGELPVNISTKFQFLMELSAGKNQLNGSLPLSFIPSSLQILDLSGNNIRGLFQDIKGFGQKCDLMLLDLSNNQIIGQFPDLSNVLSLQSLDLSGNQLQGALSETIGKLLNLTSLFASSNLLGGVVTEAHFSNITKLLVLDLSFNEALSFNFSANWVPHFQLLFLSLANCKVGPQFPNWLQTQLFISYLDISYGNISDTIPKWFCNSSSNWASIDLSNNNIDGRLPNMSTNQFLKKFLRLEKRSIHLSYNNFGGPIPLFLLEFSIIHLSNNKFVGPISLLCSIISSNIISIDLSYNQLSGEIPDCWNNSTSLLILDLGNNHFTGKFPPSLGSIFSLQSLHLRNNHLVGELPSSLQNCTSLQVMDFGGNEFTGRIPPWIGRSLRNLVIVSLRHNKFYGDMQSHICQLNRIQILDLSKNKLTGKIPQCFNNFTLLMQNTNHTKFQYVLPNIVFFRSNNYVDNILVQWKKKDWEYRKQLGLLKSIDLSSNQLIGDIPEEFSTLKGLLSLNLSNNHLTGEIFPTIYQMENLEVLDLSKNQLSGVIPTGLASLSYLAVLDLSNNSLSGKIPTGTQLQSFNASSYAGNRGLCGDPLPKCPADVPPQRNNNYYREDDDFPDQGFYISMVVGFSISFWGFVVTLVLKESWRSAYYEFLNDVKDWIYVKIKISSRRLQRKFRPT
ncbi:PREDICTED: probable LRR receptor-like serine/threonine-protein kinase At4g36180 [Ipomoea nil]|uniref:probable LRR receptor-like serine/threonine-protein kinase At4g36180 n=1 Tax=Ipomoea nil TaxID=35883 RepID=UPI000900AB4A|nr:PREDICTED: probable LRR receptor-like serine/threonine-protein kinase At4g36180 [Ipomoea nil]